MRKIELEAVQYAFGMTKREARKQLQNLLEDTREMHRKPFTMIKYGDLNL